MRMTRSVMAVAGAVLLTAAMPSVVEPVASATPTTAASPAAVRASLRRELKNYLYTYRGVEHISAVSLAVTFRGGRRGINLAVGNTLYGGRTTMSPYALWQIGSNTKSFTSVLVLQLEAQQRLSINDTLGKWLPEYPVWSGATIKQLLNMTSGIPNYTDSPEYWDAVAAAPDGKFSTSQLVSFAAGLPATHGYSYSNTNYILAQMIIERADHDSYRRRLRTQIVNPLGLQNTFYSATDYGRAITTRMPAGYWFIAALPMMTSQLANDQSRLTVSWAQGAGGIVSSLQDLGNWDRALFTGQELPRKQQGELTSLVSTTTGEPIKTTTLADPAGYGLGVSQVTSKALGTEWYYEGETDGYRVVNIYAPRSGTAIAIGVNSASLTDNTAALGTSIYQTLHQAGLSRPTSRGNRRSSPPQHGAGSKRSTASAGSLPASTSSPPKPRVSERRDSSMNKT
ncbi:MAG: serine hydrolase domain-containing protein, partial [Acidimicrobiales bacterium]